jgi:tetratricopeptide (TPR) repeat protein
MPSDLRDTLQSALGAGYTLERELGGGGMSRVFVADEMRLRRKVVVKVLSPELAAGLSAERFEREVQVAASLQQANIVPVLSAGETNGLPYYTMPFVEGESLRTRMARDGSLAISEVVSVLRDVTRALAYAHARGVVHRDIKPDNILLSGGTAVVTDFGIAKALAVAGEAQRTSGATLTQLGAAIGTPAYMAPEQVVGDSGVDHRADIYGFGCMAYELLAGASPFANRTPQRMLVAHMTEDPRPLVELRSEIPASLADLVMRCLAKDPSERPQTAAEVASVLDTLASSGVLEVGGGRDATRHTPFGRALAIYIAAAIVVLAIARIAEAGLGLPDWVFGGAVGVVIGGLGVLVFSELAHRSARRHAVSTAVRTPHGTPVTASASTLNRAAVRASPHLHWRRLARGGAYVLGAFVLIVAGYLGLGAAGIGPGASLLAKGVMSENARILVADFRVSSGPDTLLGAVVSEALRTDLGQSNVVSVVSGTAIGQALQRMQRRPDTRVDSALARELAEREGITAIVDGTITPLSAGTYIIVARLVAAEDGSQLAAFRETADAREIIEATETIAREMREEIGESLKDVRATPALSAVTTPSLDALRRYSEGLRAAEIEGDYPKAIGLLREAVAIDTTFAMAWRKLAVSLSNNGMPRAQIDSAATKAYEYRGRLTEYEAANAVGYYYQSGPGRNRQKAIEAYESILDKAPGTDASVHNLALLVSGRREFARAESLYRQRIAAGDAPVITYTNLESVLFSQGKIAEADSLRRVAQRLFPTAPQTQGTELVYLYHRGQLDSVETLGARLRAHRDLRTRSSGWYGLSGLQLLRGQVRASIRSLEQARRIDSIRGAPVPRTQDSIYLSYIDLMILQNRERAIQRFERAIATIPEEQRATFQITNFYAVSGQPEKARAIFARDEAQVRDSIARRLAEPQLHRQRGEVLLAEGKPLEAIAEFRASEMTVDGPIGNCLICLSVPLGRAFDRANMPDSTIYWFEHYLATPAMNRLNLDLDVSSVPNISRRLGELYEARGDRAKAAAYYQKFVDLWKNADPELQPQVAEIRQRLARLRDPEPVPPR